MNRAHWVAAGGGALAAGLALLSYWGFTVDDALISARVAHHLHDGFGYRFNIGGPIVDAVTPLGWAFLLAPFAKSPLAALDVARWFGAVCLVGVGALLGSQLAALGNNRWRFFPLLILALCAPLGAWAVSGMETGLIIGLCTVAVLQTPVAPYALFAAVFMRPELLPWAFTLCVGLSIKREVRPSSLLLAATLPWVAIISAASLRLFFFDQAAPLAVLAKPADLNGGVRYLLGALLLSGPPWLLVGSFAGMPSRLGAVAAASGVHFLAVGAAGGDWMPFFRLIAPVLPGLLLVGAAQMERSTHWKNILRGAVALLVCGAALLTHAPAARQVMNQRGQLTKALAAFLTPQDRLVTLDAGWVGAASSATIVDLSGVTDPEIARLPGGHTSKRIGNDFLQQHLERAADRGVAIVLVLLTTPDGGLREPWYEVRFDRVVEQRVALQARKLALQVLGQDSAAQQAAWLPLQGTQKHYIAVRLRPVR